MKVGIPHTMVKYWIEYTNVLKEWKIKSEVFSPRKEMFGKVTANDFFKTLAMYTLNVWNT